MGQVMRNNNSDAHGVGSQRISISEHHARFLVNSAMTMADFILSVGNNTKSTASYPKG
ncbi:abortive infection family protein [Petrotoga halophila]|uniref:abortive infection family protein n=1 Tax=Petrotoga halophila TaxID=301141 RepID=UPI001B803ADB|nr:abortive infection family protein [Petrotoga halophila]